MLGNLLPCLCIMSCIKNDYCWTDKHWEEEWKVMEGGGVGPLIDHLKETRGGSGSIILFFFLSFLAASITLSVFLSHSHHLLHLHPSDSCTHLQQRNLLWSRREWRVGRIALITRIRFKVSPRKPNESGSRKKASTTSVTENYSRKIL